MELIDHTEKKRYTLGDGAEARWFDLPKIALGAMFDKTFSVLGAVQTAAQQQVHRNADERIASIAARVTFPVIEAITVFWAYVASDLEALTRQAVADRQKAGKIVVNLEEIAAIAASLERRVTVLERGEHLYRGKSP